MNNNKPLQADSSGFPIVRDAVLSLLNQYPDLNEVIRYGTLDENGGISMESEVGAVVISENADIVGGVHRVCQFPFLVVYRGESSTEARKLEISEFLERLGSWLSQEPDAESVAEYPTLTGGRTITGISRSNVYALMPNENMTQDWCLPVTVNYTHDFTRRNLPWLIN